MDSRWRWAVLLLALGCSRHAREADGGVETRALVFEGTCDASGAVALGDGLFVVGDDENNVLRVYDSRRGGPPLRSVDVSAALGLPERRNTPEVDIEAATAFRGLALWMGSHGRSSSGKVQPARMRFFATTAPADGVDIAVVGTPSARLLEDLLADPRLSRFGLRRAAELPPKTVGGLNIEGLTATSDGSGVLIGFRSPVPEGKALLVPLLNPEALVHGAPAQLGAPLQLDLQGLGTRAITWWHGRYLVVAGGTAAEATSRLFTWRGGADVPVPVQGVDFAGLNPEALVADEAQARVLVLSDDGSRVQDGVECKHEPEAARKHFRGIWVSLPPSP